MWVCATIPAISKKLLLPILNYISGKNLFWWPLLGRDTELSLLQIHDKYLVHLKVSIAWKLFDGRHDNFYVEYLFRYIRGLFHTGRACDSVLFSEFGCHNEFLPYFLVFVIISCLFHSESKHLRALSIILRGLFLWYGNTYTLNIKKRRNCENSTWKILKILRNMYIFSTSFFNH